jgi:protein TonB
VQKIEGTVELAIAIGADGRVVSVTVVRSIPLLDAAAIEAVRHWLFRPALRRGEPVATTARVPVTFRIY